MSQGDDTRRTPIICNIYCGSGRLPNSRPSYYCMQKGAVTTPNEKHVSCLLPHLHTSFPLRSEAIFQNYPIRYCLYSWSHCRWYLWVTMMLLAWALVAQTSWSVPPIWHTQAQTHKKRGHGYIYQSIAATKPNRE